MAPADTTPPHPRGARHLQGRKKAFFSAISSLLMLITLVGCYSGGPEGLGLTETSSHSLQQTLPRREGKRHLSTGGFRGGGNMDKPLASTEIASRGSDGKGGGKLPTTPGLLQGHRWAQRSVTPFTPVGSCCVTEAAG